MLVRIRIGHVVSVVCSFTRLLLTTWLLISLLTEITPLFTIPPFYLAPVKIRHIVV